MSIEILWRLLVRRSSPVSKGRIWGKKIVTQISRLFLRSPSCCKIHIDKLQSPMVRLKKKWSCYPDMIITKESNPFITFLGTITYPTLGKWTSIFKHTLGYVIVPRREHLPRIPAPNSLVFTSRFTTLGNLPEEQLVTVMSLGCTLRSSNQVALAHHYEVVKADPAADGSEILRPTTWDV